MFNCVLVSINIPFESLDCILFHMHFKQKAFGISAWRLFAFPSQCQIYNTPYFFNYYALHCIINWNLFKTLDIGYREWVVLHFVGAVDGRS